MLLTFTRLSPHASPPELGSHGYKHVIVKCLGIGYDGRRRDPLLPANDMRWIDTGLRLEPPIPPLFIHTPFHLLDSKIEAIHWHNTDAGLHIALFSRRLDSIHLPHNDIIAWLTPVSVPSLELQEANLDGSISNSSNPPKHP